MATSPQTGAAPHYGTWIRFRAVVIFGALTAACLALALFAVFTVWALIFLVPAAAFGWIFLILALARHRFSDAGGRYQARIHQLIQSHARGSNILDIGCGNGHLAIQMAKDVHDRSVTGLDFWGAAWEYSQHVCQRNAELEGVGERVTFVHGSASALPFEDDAFDCVVSCLTFHEVRDIADKTLCLCEALRVLRPGGTFVLLDLFSDPGPYPRQELIEQRLETAGAAVHLDGHVSALLPLPFPLNGKRVLKHARLIVGEKR